MKNNELQLLGLLYKNTKILNLRKIPDNIRAADCSPFSVDLMCAFLQMNSARSFMYADLSLFSINDNDGQPVVFPEKNISDYIYVLLLTNLIMVKPPLSVD